MNRRVVLAGFAGSAVAGLAGRAVAQDDPANAAPAPGDYFIRVFGDDKSPITPESIEVGARPFQAWPVDPATDTVRDGNLFNMVLMSRWNVEDLSEAAMARQADGVVVQTAICTHAACDISDWVRDKKIFECPCHFSQFNPRDDGAVVTGPAKRKLPSLALAVADDGLVVVKEPFDSRVGGEI